MNAISRLLTAALNGLAYPVLIVYVLGREAWRVTTRNVRF
jgi:hypothetical protein